MDSAAFEASLQEIGWKSPFLSIQQPEIMKENIFFLTYCAEHAIYRVFQEDAALSDMTWDEFVYTLHSLGEIREIAVLAVRKTIQKWFSSPDFVLDTERNAFPIDERIPDPKSDKIHLAALFSDEVGRGLIEMILLKIEIHLHKQAQNSGRACSWEEFIQALSKDKGQWDDIIVALRNAIAQLDFKPAWISESSK